MADDNKVALIDLDGTIADYEGAVWRGLEKLASYVELEHLDPIKEWALHTKEPWLDARIDLIKKQDGFWEGLEEIRTGMLVYELLGEMGYQRQILTQGPRTTESAWTEKKRWCSKHVPEASVTITQDKSGSYGKVLYDDYPRYIKGWLEHRPRGHVLMNDASYNRDFIHPNMFRVERFDREGQQPDLRAQLKRIEEFLNTKIETP